MMNRSIFFVMLLVVACLSSCGGNFQSNSAGYLAPVSPGESVTTMVPETEYRAQITLYESDTTLQVVKLDDQVNSEVPPSDPLETISLGYGSIAYLINQGSVPDWALDVPGKYKNRYDLAVNDVGPCVISPLLNLMTPIIATYGITKRDIPITVSYNTANDEVYPPELVERAGKTIDEYIYGLGYNDAAYPPELPEEEEAATDLSGYGGVSSCARHEHAAYTHKDSSGTSNTDWMRPLSNDLTLSEISIPGTHDTMAYKCEVHAFVNSVLTQSMDLREQLKSGIRALDIRCRHINNSFAIHHGSYYLKANFDDVLKTVSAFLDAHKDETIVMRVQEEYTPTGNTRTFADTFQDYVKHYPGLFWTYNKDDNDIYKDNPKLGKIRGKIVLLQDFNSSPQMGIRWDTTQFQDDYKLKTNWDLYDKWEKVKRHLDSASRGERGRIYVNFLSGSTGSFPYFVASGKSSPGDRAPLLLTGSTTRKSKDNHKYPDFPRVSCTRKYCSIAFLGTNILTSDRLGNYGRVGLVMADFPGRELIQKVIGRN